MSENREQQIRERAHALWEADGRPEGREMDYWLRAEKEVDGQEGVPDMTSEPPL